MRFKTTRGLWRKSLTNITKKTIYLMAGIILALIIWELLIQFWLWASFSGRGTGFDNNVRQFLPLSAVKALWRMLLLPVFWYSILDSLKRILLGLFLGALIGIPCGLLLGVSRILRQLTDLPIQFLRMVSPISWMPIALFFLPGFEEAILFLITIAAIWPILLNTTMGVAQLNKNWINMARNQGANTRQLLLKVIFPGSIPSILAGLRLALGVAWVVLVPAELLGTSRGLGYLINDARDTLEYDKLIALILVIGLIGFSLDAVFKLVKKRFDWQLKG